MTWLFLPLQPSPNPVPAPPTPASPGIVSVELPPALYEKLDSLRPSPAGSWWDQFVNSPAAVVGVCSVIVGIVALLLSWRAVKRQIDAAQQREVEAAKRDAVLNAVDALHGLYDVLIDIDDVKKSRRAVGSAELTAYRSAHAASRRAMLKLEVFGFNRDEVIRPYDKVRDSAYDFVHGPNADRSHTELGDFRAKRKAMVASLKELVGPPS